ncbi:alpha/beta fold hydrolase [Methanobacterium sp.]|uniref:alpha/beta fold hydrolase n=1 Tax=Methanobacterium sp. TaxID=2164 RepID=UPI003C722843
MPTVKVNDINMYYKVCDEGDSLVILQEAGIEITSMRNVLDTFAENYQVISLDNLGAGRTDMPDEPYSIEMMAYDTVELMNKISIKSAHFLGISMGSRIVQVIAAKYPERLKCLIVNVAAASFPDVFKSILDISLENADLREKLLQKTGIVFIQKYPPNPESFLRQLKALADFDGRDYLGQIKAPTLIINGTKDHLVPMELTEELAASIKDSKLVLVDGGHYFAALKPQLLIEHGLEFLKEFGTKMFLKQNINMVKNYDGMH